MRVSSTSLDHLVDQLRVDVGGPQLRSCQRGRSFLVVGLSRVDRVVEPRRQLGRLGVVAVLGQQRDRVEHLAQVPLVVVPAVRLAPAVEQSGATSGGRRSGGCGTCTVQGS